MFHTCLLCYFISLFHLIIQNYVHVWNAWDWLSGVRPDVHVFVCWSVRLVSLVRRCVSVGSLGWTSLRLLVPSGSLVMSSSESSTLSSISATTALDLPLWRPRPANTSIFRDTTYTTFLTMTINHEEQNSTRFFFLQSNSITSVIAQQHVMSVVMYLLL